VADEKIEQRTSIGKMRILRKWSCGVIKESRIRNEYIRGKW